MDLQGLARDAGLGALIDALLGAGIAFGIRRGAGNAVTLTVPLCTPLNGDFFTVTMSDSATAPYVVSWGIRYGSEDESTDLAARFADAWDVAHYLWDRPVYR